MSLKSQLSRPNTDTNGLPRKAIYSYNICNLLTLLSIFLPLLYSYLLAKHVPFPLDIINAASEIFPALKAIPSDAKNNKNLLITMQSSYTFTLLLDLILIGIIIPFFFNYLKSSYIHKKYNKKFFHIKNLPLIIIPMIHIPAMYYSLFVAMIMPFYLSCLLVTLLFYQFVVMAYYFEIRNKNYDM